MRKRSAVSAMLTIVLALILAGCSAGTPAAQKPLPPNPPVAAPPKPEAPKITQPTITAKEISEKKPEIEISIRIPVLTGLQDTTLQAKLNAGFEKHALDWSKEAQKKASEFAALAKQQQRAFRPGTFIYDYRVTFNRNGLVSLSTQGYEYTGGAHGVTVRTSHNYDLRSGSTLVLGDLFQPGSDYRTPINAEISKLIAIRQKEFFQGKEGFASIKPDHPFYIADAGIVITFGHYEIAPYSSGLPEFAFDPSLLPGLRDAYAQAIKSRYEIGSGRRFQIRSYTIESNTPDSARIVFDLVSTAGAWDTLKPKVKVLTGSEPVFMGEGKVKDATLGKFRAELMFSDTGLQESMRKLVGLKTVQISSDKMLQAFRVAYPPDDAAMVFYFGCSAKPQVKVTEDYGRLIVELKK